MPLKHMTQRRDAMTTFANAMEIFKLLEKSNCRKCNEPTCLAFASKVFLGQKPLSACPALAPEVLARYGSDQARAMPGEADWEKHMAGMKERLKGLDLEAAAQRTGGVFADGRLTLRIFGKPFSMDNSGRFITDIHVNPWLLSPVLTYVFDSKGVRDAGNWVAFREFENARELNGLFVKRTEEPLRKLADATPGLFEDLMILFDGKQVEQQFASDISLVLHPLPLIPMLICYWKPEDGMASEFHLFFDASASQNGGADMVFRLTAGIVAMIEKLSLTHRWQMDSA